MDVQFTVDTFTAADGQVLRYGHLHAPNGDGPGHAPIVFVPGLGGSVKFALTFLQRLVPHHGPIYGLDSRAIGLNEGIAPKPHPASYLDDFKAFISHLQQDEHLNSRQAPILMGLSLGAVYAAMYASENASPFTGLVLLAPAFLPHPKLFDWRFKFANYSGVLLKGPYAKTTLPYGIRDLTRNPEKYEDPNFQDPLTLPTFYLFLVDRLCRKAFNQCRQITMPTAIVVPELDTICDPVAMRQALDRITHPNKALFHYPQLYHDVVQEPEDDLNLVCKDLSCWIDALTGGKPLQPVATQHSGRQ